MKNFVRINEIGENNTKNGEIEIILKNLLNIKLISDEEIVSIFNFIEKCVNFF